MKIEWIDLEDIKEYPGNPRHNENAVEPVAASMREFGFLVPLVLDSDHVIVAGDTRKKAAKLNGWTKAPCIIAEQLTPEQIRAFRLVDNKVAEIADWDISLLQEELQLLAGLDLDMSQFGFDESLFEDVNVFDDEYEPEPPENPITKTGELYALGEHRLLCGDATLAEDVKKLMGDMRADLYVTDPPYNVDYHGITKQRQRIQNDDMKPGEFKVFLTNAFAVASDVMRPGAAFYIWHSDNMVIVLREACQEAGLMVKQCLVWVKHRLTFSRQDYQWQHESCLYGWKKGAAHYFTDDMTNATVYEERPNIDKMKKDELKALVKRLLDPDVPTTVIHESKPRANDVHPTMKPIPLLAPLIRNSSRKGEIVLDTFGGSGSTMMACEQLGRRCFMAEVDPRYCDVIIKRYEDMTGEKAQKL